MAGQHQPRDNEGRFTHRGGINPGATPPRSTPRVSQSLSSDTTGVEDVRADYAELWQRAHAAHGVRAFEYSVVTADEELLWGTVWARSVQDARNRAVHRYTSRGFDEGEFTIASVEPSPDDGFQDAQDTYRVVLESVTGRWLLRESHYPTEDGGGWVAVNAVNEHLQIRHESGRWVLTEWDAGNGLIQPSVLELGSFSSPEECVSAGDARLANCP